MSVVNALLEMMVKQNASDLYLVPGSPPSMKIDGKMVSVGTDILKQGSMMAITKEILSEEDRHEFLRRKEVNLALSIPGVGRFRVNGYFQRDNPSFVIRRINSKIPTLASLGLPPILTDLSMTKRGLILFVGATGSGKSTSLAAMVGYRNQNDAGHILTIEDPVEFLHANAMSIVSQREVGIDTDSYEEALKNALRQAPDVILIGEIRSRETMEHAIAFAETGHLCLSTLHANNANQALDRIINFFPSDRRDQLLLDLSLNMVGIVSQRLVPKKGGGRMAAIEVLLGSPRVKDLVHKGEVGLIKETMSKSTEIGMQTFDQALTKLVMDGLVEYKEALLNADSQNDFRLNLKMACLQAGKEDLTADAEDSTTFKVLD